MPNFIQDFKAGYVTLARKWSNLKRVPILPAELEEIKKSTKFPYVHEWICTNPHAVRLRIRSTTPKKDGPSNFDGVYPKGFPTERMRGHSLIPSSLLNWEGLAEERGWQLDPVLCPACKRGMSVQEYRLSRTG